MNKSHGFILNCNILQVSLPLSPPFLCKVILPIETLPLGLILTSPSPKMLIALLMSAKTQLVSSFFLSYLVTNIQSAVNCPLPFNISVTTNNLKSYLKSSEIIATVNL